MRRCIIAAIRMLLNFSLVSAAAMTLAYYPIIKRRSFGFVSTYPKADMTRLALAATVDVMLVVVALFYYNRFESLRYLILAAAYVLLKDALGGRSVGKFLFSLFVVNLETGRPSGFGACMRRNALLILPGANVVASFLEARTHVRDPQGQRLGDRFALTQVVEGFGAKDLVTAVQQWLSDLIKQLVDQLGDKVRKPSHAPVKR